MKIPKEAQHHIDRLAEYKVNDDLDTCNLVHLYDTGEFGAMENGESKGFVDSKIFNVWAFNFEKKEKRLMEFKDELWFPDECCVKNIRIYADGSTMVSFKRLQKIGWGQSLTFN